MNSFNDEGSFGGAAGTKDDTVTAVSILCALLRIRSIGTSESNEITEIDRYEGRDDDDVPFDPFSDDMPILELPGVRTSDIGDENVEVALLWSMGRSG